MTVADVHHLIDTARRVAPPAEPDEASQHRGWRLPEPISADELHAARTAPRCIVDRYLWADVAALIAPGGSSKTTLSLREFVCIVLGRPLWGLEVRAPGPVLLVTAEDRREFLVARLRRICESMDLTPAETSQVREQVRIYDCTADLRRLTAVVADVVVVSELAREMVDACSSAGFVPALVQFDPMVSFGVGESRVNDAEQGLINAARVITAGLDCAVRFVHHTGISKALDKADHQYAGRGGSALADGCRMVHVLTTVDDAELYRATGEHLAADDMAIKLSRPKLSYCPPATQPLYIVRRGYRFDLLRALRPQTSDEHAASVGQQLARFLEAEATDGRRHTKHTLEQLRPENMGRNDVRAGLAWLVARGAVYDVPAVGPDGKMPARGSRTYLATSGEPAARRAP
jgi:RecA-family ATPase